MYFINNPTNALQNTQDLFQQFYSNGNMKDSSESEDFQVVNTLQCFGIGFLGPRPCGLNGGVCIDCGINI